MAGERRGHPVAGWVIAVMTVLVTVGPVVALMAINPYIKDVAGMDLSPIIAVVLVVALVLLAVGLRLAWQVRRGGVGPSMGTPEYRIVNFTWQVSEPGAHVRLSPGGEESVWLPVGATVKEVGERHQGFIRVITLGDETGWLDRRQVQPPADEPSPPA